MKKSERQKYKEYAAVGRKLNIDALQGKRQPKEIYYHLEARKSPGDRDIETCKKKIESWYDEETFNPSIAETLMFNRDDFDKEVEKLRALKSQRKRFYKSSEKNKNLLNVICNYPDVMVRRRGQYPDKLTLGRDLDRPRAKLYEQAKDNIQKYVKKQNKRLAKQDLFFSYLSTVDVEIGLRYAGEYIDPLPTLPKSIREIVVFLRKLSFILYPSIPEQWERANKICEILNFFYGIPSKYADPDNIRKYIEKDESKEIITLNLP